MQYEDYPKNFEEFIERFKTEDDCFDYIAKLRWPNGFVCPKYNSNKAWKTKMNLFRCSNCEHETSIMQEQFFGEPVNL